MVWKVNGHILIHALELNAHIQLSSVCSVTLIAVVLLSLPPSLISLYWVSLLGKAISLGPKSYALRVKTSSLMDTGEVVSTDKRSHLFS